MPLILDIDFDVFVDPVARNLEENGPRLQAAEHKIDNPNSILEYISNSLRYNNWTRGSILTHHVEALATIENEIQNNHLLPPFQWIHIDAHDDLSGHWNSPTTSGNFLYRMFLNNWIGEFTFVYREHYFDFPKYILNFNEETYEHTLDINRIIVPIFFGHLYQYILPQDPDYVLLTLSPAFTPETIDPIFQEVSQKIANYDL